MKQKAGTTWSFLETDKMDAFLAELLGWRERRWQMINVENKRNSITTSSPATAEKIWRYYELCASNFAKLRWNGKKIPWETQISKYHSRKKMNWITLFLAKKWNMKLNTFHRECPIALLGNPSNFQGKDSCQFSVNSFKAWKKWMLHSAVR